MAASSVPSSWSCRHCGSRQQLFGEPVQRLWEFVCDRTRPHSRQYRRLRLCVLLQHHAAQDLNIPLITPNFWIYIESLPGCCRCPVVDFEDNVENLSAI